MTADNALLSVWTNLWNDFERRAVELSDGRKPGDSVDRVISWMQDGSPYTWKPGRAVGEFHLPELYSGAPWRTPGRKWAAFLTLNPSIHEEDVFPTVEMMTTVGVEPLIKHFEDRFDCGPVLMPIPYGRGPTGTCWAYRKIVGQSRRPWTWCQPSGARAVTVYGHWNPTWSALDKVLKSAAGSGLGTSGAVMDVVPLKFKSWSEATADLDVKELLTYGWKWLSDALQALAASGCAPACIAWMGTGTWPVGASILPGNPERDGLEVAGKHIPFSRWPFPGRGTGFEGQKLALKDWLARHLV